MAFSRYHRSLTNTIAHWMLFDKQVIDPMNVEQLREVATLLHVNPTRVYDAIQRVGARGGDIRKYLQQQQR